MIQKETSENISIYQIEEEVEALYLDTKIRCDIVSLTLSQLCIALANLMLVIFIISLIQNPAVWKGIVCVLLVSIAAANIYTYLKDTSITYLNKVTRLHDNFCKFLDQETDVIKE